MGGTFLGVPIIRIIMFNLRVSLFRGPNNQEYLVKKCWGVYWSTLFWESTQYSLFVSMCIEGV